MAERWTGVKTQPAVSAAHGTGESSQDNQPAGDSDFCAIQVPIKKFTLAKFSVPKYSVETGSVTSRLQSGPKHIAIITTTKRSVDSGYKSIIIQFMISWGLFLLPCKNNTEASNLKISKVEVK